MVGQRGRNREDTEEIMVSDRTQQLAKLRRRFLQGTLDEVLVNCNEQGLERLIDEVLVRYKV